MVAHGAWSSAWAWQKMRPLLREAGHELFTPSYTGLGERGHLASPAIDLDTHIADILAVLKFEDLNDVVLIGHSYGGMVATGVADRVRGAGGEADLSRRLRAARRAEPVRPGRAGDRVADAAGRLADRATAGRCRPNPMPPDTPPDYVAWATPRTAFAADQDLRAETAIVVARIAAARLYLLPATAAARLFSDNSPARAKAEGWLYADMDASHNPHITTPLALAGRAAGDDRANWRCHLRPRHVGGLAMPYAHMTSRARARLCRAPIDLTNLESNVEMTFRFIGKSLPRTEDFRLIRGLGRYTADLAPQDALRLYILRSPHGAARIRSIDTGAAQAMPGVQLVLTGDDPELAALGSIPSKVKRKAPDGSPNFEPPYRMLAHERALFVGDAVAAVFAQTVDQAKDAAEAIEIDYEPLPTITETRRAPDSGSAQLWPQSPNNICFIHDAGDRKAVDEALAKAKHKVSVTYVINRITAVTMEARAALATYDRGGREPIRCIAGCRIRTACATCWPTTSSAFPATASGWWRPMSAAASG